MKREQLIRILALDEKTIKLSDSGRLIPPNDVVCYGLPFGNGDINKMDCKFCMLYHEKPPKYKSTQNFVVIEINTSEVKPFRSNITNRFLCPLCINKNIDTVDSGIYYKKNLDFILDLYDLCDKLKPKHDWNNINL